MTITNPNIELNQDGWHWPKNDTNCWKWTNDRVDVPQRISKYVDNKICCVHAGANCGFYTKQYSKLFQNVYVFEPDFDNFYCLNLNVPENNVYKFQSFLGDEHKLFALEKSTDIGGHNLGKYPQAGAIPMLKIDDLNLNNCDLIHLDVEGFEIEVLRGAIITITKFRPIIAVEIAWSDATDMLVGLGYEKKENIDGDWIFIPK